MSDSSVVFDVLHVEESSYRYVPISQIDGSEKLPGVLKVLLENVLRYHADSDQALPAARALVEAGLQARVGQEVEFMPARVLFQDLTGVPVMVDFASMRQAVVDLGADPSRVNPLIHCDLVIDHSVIADVAGCADALCQNEAMEFKRNEERYRFLKWAQSSLHNMSILPPASGICHQLNIEYLSQGVFVDAAQESGAAPLAYFDSVVGTDSHTTTADGIGVLSWGVGGIEAEAAALGQPIPILVPKTYGLHLSGKLGEGISAMDLALTVAALLRKVGVVGCFVEAFGPGVATLSATQRTCVSNMSPEYGCTCLFFPFDEKTRDYYALTGHSPEQVKLIEAYAKAQGLWTDDLAGAVYADVIELDLSQVPHVIAGPSRPHERIELAKSQSAVRDVIVRHGRTPQQDGVSVCIADKTYELNHGAIAIAALTSCTTTADPHMMLAAGLLAQKAAEAGIYTKPWIKKLLSPGSHATHLLLERTHLLPWLEMQGFYTAGFGCMSCIGNSGPLMSCIHDIADSIDLVAVVSGNRNFDGRISPDVSQNYLAAPALVVAYALAGTVDFDFETDSLGQGPDGPVYLRDIWPTSAEIRDLADQFVTSDLYTTATAGIEEGSEAWRSIEATSSLVFAWDEESTYIRNPPYFENMGIGLPQQRPVEGARALVFFGDFITTDHISPAGSIAKTSPAADYLRTQGVQDADFNTYGTRRGNHEVMQRGTFANVKLQNRLAQGRTGCWTLNQLTDEMTSVWDAAVAYKEAGIPLVVIAGQMYGSGSSRDWAAKGPMLQGVRAVLASSFERIHRSNLIGMGVLPLEFMGGQNAETLGLCGLETYSIEALDFEHPSFPMTCKVSIQRPSGAVDVIEMLVRVDTPTEALYMANGGILQYMVRRMAQA